MNRDQRWPWHRIRTWRMDDPSQVPALREMERILGDRDWFPLHRFRTIRIGRLDEDRRVVGCHWRDSEFMVMEWTCPKCGFRIRGHLDVRETGLPERDDLFHFTCGHCRTQFKVSPSHREVRVWKIYRLKPGPKPEKQGKLFVLEEPEPDLRGMNARERIIAVMPKDREFRIGEIVDQVFPDLVKPEPRGGPSTGDRRQLPAFYGK